MPQLPSVSELLVGGHIPPVNTRSLGSSPETRPAPLGSSPRQTDPNLSLYYPRTSSAVAKSQSIGSSGSMGDGSNGSNISNGSSPTSAHPPHAPDSTPTAYKQQCQRPTEASIPMASVASRRASAEYASQGYERSYVVHSTPANDYFSYRDPTAGRSMADSRQQSAEHLNRMPSYNSATSSESIQKIGTTPPGLASPDFRSRPRPASFSHAPITSMIYPGAKSQVVGTVTVNASYPHGAPTSCTSPHGAASIYGPTYAYTQAPQYIVHTPIHGNVPVSNQITNPNQMTQMTQMTQMSQVANQMANQMGSQISNGMPNAMQSNMHSNGPVSGMHSMNGMGNSTAMHSVAIPNGAGPMASQVPNALHNGQSPSVPMQNPVHSGNVPASNIPHSHSSNIPHSHSSNMAHSTVGHSSLAHNQAHSNLHGAPGGMQQGMYNQAYHSTEQQGMTQEQNNALLNRRRVTKRRTRSGCMTCRKRRIKCDERKPHCYNCERSKKLCLGYELVSNTRRPQDPDVLKSKARLSVQSLM